MMKSSHVLRGLKIEDWRLEIGSALCIGFGLLLGCSTVSEGGRFNPPAIVLD